MIASMDLMGAALAPWLAGTLVLGVFALFATERRPAYDSAFLGAAVALASMRRHGLVSPHGLALPRTAHRPYTRAMTCTGRGWAKGVAVEHQISRDLPAGRVAGQFSRRRAAVECVPSHGL